jgi:hypothetical protein
VLRAETGQVGMLIGGNKRKEKASKQKSTDKDYNIATLLEWLAS